jgi:5-methylcytosine-specific restriction endonuclease McrA
MTQFQYHKQWVEKNKEHVKEYMASYHKKHRAKNREKLITQAQSWREDNKERIAATGKLWAKTHPEQVRLIRHNRRMRLLNVEGRFSLKEWQDLKAVYNYLCLKCLRSEPEIRLTVDHKIPLIKGGTNWPDNIQPLCGPCNSSKHTKIWFAHCSLALRNVFAVS